MSPTEAQDQVRRALSRSAFTWVDLVPWAVIAAAYFLIPSYLPLGTQVIIMVVFALSLDLMVGYGGVETLGHAALFGAGSYAAGLFALHVSPEPVTGLLLSGLAGSLVALISGPFVLRMKGITLVTLTLAVTAALSEFANSAGTITGGADGLYGFQIRPIFGRFAFDFQGHTAYLYAATVMAVVFFLCKMIVNSPFGLAIRGIRENATRTRLLGIPVLRRLVLLYVISGFFAGMAGGLSTQITQLVGLDSLSSVLSGNVLVMLVLGGTGSLYGAIVGAFIFVVLSDRVAAWSPYHWLFVVGIMLILTVRFAPSGFVALLKHGEAR